MRATPHARRAAEIRDVRRRVIDTTVNAFSETTAASAPAWDCQACGACCATDPSWPRFTLEPDAVIAMIDPALLDATQSAMRCEVARCCALSGTIGQTTACSIYALRPLVCRDCRPGDPECLMARAAHGLPVV